MKLWRTFYLSSVLTLTLISCGSDDLTNVRAYVVGKVVSESTAIDDLEFSLVSENKVIAQTKPNSAGAFVLSGPLVGNSFSFISNKKIKSFTATQQQCKLSTDSLSILVPEGISYLELSKVEIK